MSELAMERAQVAITPMEMIQRAAAQGASIEQMQQLFDLKLRVEADEARKAFNEAMTQFKANPPRIVKNVQKQAGQMMLHYASLDSICKSVIPALSAVGIRHNWKLKQENGQMTVTCILSHVQGHSEETPMSGPYDQSGGKNAIQAIASAKSYLERYTLLAATGLAAEFGDDDGDAAGKKPTMPESELIDAISSFDSARSLEELKKMFGSAYKAAQGYNDTIAMADIKKAYDKRKAAMA